MNTIVFLISHNWWQSAAFLHEALNTFCAIMTVKKEVASPSEILVISFSAFQEYAY
jgi:hypothetical protein